MSVRSTRWPNLFRSILLPKLFVLFASRDTVEPGVGVLVVFATSDFASGGCGGACPLAAIAAHFRPGVPPGEEVPFVVFDSILANAGRAAVTVGGALGMFGVV